MPADVGVCKKRNGENSGIYQVSTQSRAKFVLSEEKWLGPPVTLRHLPMAVQIGAGAPAGICVELSVKERTDGVLRQVAREQASMHSCGDHHGADCWRSC